MLLLLVTVVLEDLSELVILGRDGPLVVPVDSLELLDQGYYRAVVVARFLVYEFDRLVICFRAHEILLSSMWTKRPCIPRIYRRVRISYRETGG